MNTPFIHEDFLLQSEAARRLYHEHASLLPILDYHSHLPPEAICLDRRYDNLTQIWLEGDHYKWRAMRANGVEERYCTGDASDWEKFEKWAETVPACLRNPLYHWTHLELARPFGIKDRLLGPDTARSIWEDCNAMLEQPGFSTRGILTRMQVELLCSTDDPSDDLEAHQTLARDPDFMITVLPTFRPDRAMATRDAGAFKAYVDLLAAVADMEIGSYQAYLEALRRRHDHFHAVGCRLSDHGIETVPAADCSQARLCKSFDSLRLGKEVGAEDALAFESAMLHEFAVMDHEKGWTQQLHLGALRNCNSRMYGSLGPDCGCDSMGDSQQARSLARFLDRLDRNRQLPKTILYNNGAGDGAVLATMIGNFQDGSVPGKMQYGSAWWHLDQWDGMSRQIEDLSNMGLLSRFVGMLTDSRSFLSFTRHDYFRRLLCNILGEDMQRGAIPEDFDMVGKLVRDICYHNAKAYFGFKGT